MPAPTGSSSNSRCIVAVGGADPELSRHQLGSDVDLADALVIAADSGVAHARRLGLIPNIVVGDFDSAAADDLSWAAEHGADLISHPRDKDATDFDLALQLALTHGADEIIAIGVFGGRVDHFLANMAVVASPRFASACLRIIDASTDVWVLHPNGRESQILPLNAGTTVSLLAWGGDAVVTTTGLCWNLDAATLAWDASTGVSNEVLESGPTILVSRGVVLAIVEKGQPPSGTALEVER